MKTVTATDLKQRLGEVLDLATLQKVAIERHGQVVAYLVPAGRPGPAVRGGRRARGPGLSRAQESRLVDLFASGDLRPSRWARGGNASVMAGFAAFLASVDEGDRARLFSLAERLHPGSSSAASIQAWLEESGVDPARLLPMLAARRAELASH